MRRVDEGVDEDYKAVIRPNLSSPCSISNNLRLKSPTAEATRIIARGKFLLTPSLGRRDQYKGRKISPDKGRVRAGTI